MCVVHSSFFFFNDTATTEIYTLSLHDALPICLIGDATQAGRFHLSVDCVGGHFDARRYRPDYQRDRHADRLRGGDLNACDLRSEEHTSELQSHLNLVCRLLLEKKKKQSSIALG